MHTRKLAAGLLTVALGMAQTATPIKHVVVIFQENVSFDHYFATYPNALNGGGEPLFIAGRKTPNVNGLSGPLLTNNPNSAQPFRLTRANAIVCDQSHDYTSEQKAMDGGLMDKFVELDGTTQTNCNDLGKGKGLVMGYYDGNTVTALWNYAQHFAMNDNFFSTNFGPSTLGHLNLISGNTNGATLMNDVGNSAGALLNGTTVINDIQPGFDDCVPKTQNSISMSGLNIGDLLNQKGVTWGWFQGGFAPSSVNADGTAVCATTHKQFDGTASRADYVPNHDPFQYFQSTSNPHHTVASSTAMIGQTDAANHQYDMADFFRALSAGNLPAVSLLKAPAYQDGHAMTSNPLDEQTFLVNTITALEDSPFWDSTAVIISWDDSDGWYDHVMPPIVSGSSSTADALSGAGACGAQPMGAPSGRCGYGQRLPLMVISRHAKTNFVDHTITDQTSILRFIEDNWNLGRIGGASLDAISGSLFNMFEFEDGGNARKLYLDPTTGRPR